MGNMSYCRFENTLKDLRDCQDTLSDSGLDDLSEDELKAAKRLIEVCGEISGEFSDLVED